MLQKLLVSAILHALVQRCNVWHRDVHIIREVGAVEHRGLSALADTRGNPLALVHRMQGLVYVVQIVERVLHGEVIPVARTRHRLVEIAVFHGDDVGIEELGKFLDVSLAQCILGVVAFSYEHGRTVESSVAEYHSLLKTALGSILGIQLLLDEEHIFSGKCVLFSVSTSLTPGSVANSLPASPSSAASICKGRMKSSSINFKDLNFKNFNFIFVSLLYFLF